MTVIGLTEVAALNREWALGVIRRVIEKKERIMKTPVEIAASAMSFDPDWVAGTELHKMAWRAIAALESAGFRIVDTENVTYQMLRSASVEIPLDDSSDRDLENGIHAALRAAPKWTKGDANDAAR